jgi:hypothetical protein
MSLGTWYLPSPLRKNQGDLENRHAFVWGRYIRQQGKKLMMILFLWHPWTTSSPTEKSAAFQGEYSALFKTMPHTVLISFGAILVLLDLDQDPVSARKCGFRNKIVFTSRVVKQHTHLPPPPPPNHISLQWRAKYNRTFCLQFIFSEIFPSMKLKFVIPGSFLSRCVIMLNWINTE